MLAATLVTQHIYKLYIDFFLFVYIFTQPMISCSIRMILMVVETGPRRLFLGADRIHVRLNSCQKKSYFEKRGLEKNYCCESTKIEIFLYEYIHIYFCITFIYICIYTSLLISFLFFQNVVTEKLFIIFRPPQFPVE